MLLHNKSYITRLNRMLLTAFTALTITGCASLGKSVTQEAAMVDDGKRNTMLVSYDVTMNVTEKYVSVGSTDLVVNCGKSNRLGNVPECFRFNIPFKGKRNINGYEYYTFEDAGAKVLQMPYGAFNFDSIRHNVLVDIERYQKCSRHTYRNKSVPLRSRFSRSSLFRADCFPVTVDVTAEHFSETPSASPITIRSGNGCYAGHLSIEMTDGELVSYTLDQNATSPGEKILELLPTNIQSLAKERVTMSCSSI